ncbi:RxLR-like protein [Plasmopara halstedii]|uniref:RxLR-like protein n=1 Tax=Plasmopara halstedii TaxID=4781 RepID=A0A0P1AY52_PLAHL|nr:RxLR-like protein [Plasmopara halstedii]CEG45642.1 RxLR-like protein [Plasmopara halstedii]|eukprot:XP_024582011.1 RxLR-like protein [Plasmopara halstedii]
MARLSLSQWQGALCWIALIHPILAQLRHTEFSTGHTFEPRLLTAVSVVISNGQGLDDSYTSDAEVLLDGEPCVALIELLYALHLESKLVSVPSLMPHGMFAQFDSDIELLLYVQNVFDRIPLVCATIFSAT